MNKLFGFPVRPILLYIFVALATCFYSSSNFANQWELQYAQGLIGTQDMDAAWTIEHEDGSSTTARDDLIYLGGLTQYGKSEGLFQYGFEAGGMFTFQNDINYFFVSSGGLDVEISASNHLWALDLFGGVYVSVNPNPSLRLYAAAGPAFVLGSLYVGEDDVEINPLENEGTNITLDLGGRQNATDISLYGRAGLDFIPVQDLIIGISARKMRSELDFDNNGVVSLDGTQYFLTFTRKY